MKTDNISIRQIVGLLIRTYILFVLIGACVVAIATVAYYFKHGEWAFSLKGVIRTLIGAGIYSSFAVVSLFLQAFLARRKIRHEKQKD